MRLVSPKLGHQVQIRPISLQVSRREGHLVHLSSDLSTIINGRYMKIRITAVRKASYPDLMAKYENPIEHTCDVLEGQEWISIDGQCPEGMCPSAWGSMREFVEALARGEGNFYDGWMKNPKSAMISCNDGFRPVSFYIEVI